MTKPATRITAILGALILLLTAGFHLSALPEVISSTAGVKSDFFRHALPSIWMTPAAHWIFMAFLSFGLSRYRSRSCAAILMAFGVLLLVDALMTLLHVGAFAGVYMLAAAGLLWLASGVSLRKDLMS